MLRLPGRGPTDGIHRPITPQRAGTRRLRACIYYKNVLLQSVVLEAAVALRGSLHPGSYYAFLVRIYIIDGESQF